MIRARLLFGIEVSLILLVAAITVAGQEIPETSQRPGYVLTPEDTIQVRVPDAEEFPAEKNPYRIDNEGYVNLPLIGRWRVGGLTVHQAESELTDRLKNFYLKPRVSVTVADQHTLPVSILGAVNNPGLQRINGQETIVEGLARAGGLRIEAGQTVTVTRRLEYGKIPLPGAKVDPTGKFSSAQMSLPRIVSGELAAENIQLQPHDVVTVARAPIIYVLGEVAKTGAFVLNENEEITTLKALTLAGGFSRTAAPGNARLLRRTAGTTERRDIPVNLSAIMKNRSPDVSLQAEDILYIPGSLTKKISMRSIEAAIGVGTSLATWRAVQ